MSNPNIKPSDRVTTLAKLSPISQGAGAVSTGWFDMRIFDSILATIIVGVLGASATVDCKLEQATDSGGTGVKDVTGKAITQLVKATDDGKYTLLNCRSDELDVTNSFCFVRLTLTVGTAASLTAALVQGFDARFGPGTHVTGNKEVIS